MSDEYDGSKYLATVDAILSVADLELITVKRIRNALQELFGVDLLPHKVCIRKQQTSQTAMYYTNRQKQINALIKTRYWDLADKRKAEEEDEDDEEETSTTKVKVKSDSERLKEIEKKDALLAAKLQRMDSKRYSTRSVDKPRETKKIITKKRQLSTKQKNTGFNKEMALSPELSQVVQTNLCSRPQVVKLMWKYIKESELQDPTDKRKIICDEKLRALFKKPSVGAFEMNKILSKHIFPKDDTQTESKINGEKSPPYPITASSEEPGMQSELLDMSDIDSS
ncbi:uncharacterized protein KQ657_002837 [Scheffersomyces spartinae]|uniref:DM2 domain-containing protein n=1 Tax=Scheffersomyces spartinae TaxID=45513 RepID=A0A9P7V5U8_9ASCO|nr:uncharacterized protein KQ657_002837 [Scheffersomyces spartinae]KAG7191701.1 hypothetical protein KQ657_002837 [Scheffersomyces spartinae]